MPENGEKWSEHPENFFGDKIGPKGSQKKKGDKFIEKWPIFGRKCEKKGVLGDLENSMLPKFPAISAEKQHLLKNCFVQFLVNR